MAILSAGVGALTAVAPSQSLFAFLGLLFAVALLVGLAALKIGQQGKAYYHASNQLKTKLERELGLFDSGTVDDTGLALAVTPGQRRLIIAAGDGNDSKPTERSWRVTDYLHLIFWVLNVAAVVGLLIVVAGFVSQALPST